MPTIRPVMNQAARDAYLSAYNRAVSRHGTWSPISATSTGVAATASPAVTRAAEMTFGEMVQAFLRVYWSKVIEMFLFLGWYIVLPALILSFLYFLYWVGNWGEWADDLIDQMQPPEGGLEPNYDSPLANTAVIILLCFIHPIQMARIIADEVREAFTNTKAWIDRKLRDMRYNQYTDTAYLRYQEITFFIGRHKFLLFVAFCVIWLFSGMIESQNKGIVSEKFVEWADQQRYYNRPVPEVLLRARKEQGSNSHYRKRQEPNEPPEPIEQYEWNEALDAETLPVETIIEEWSEPPPFKTIPFEKVVESAREEDTAAPPPRPFVREGYGQDECGDPLLSEPDPFEKIVQTAWEEGIAAQRPRTYVGKDLVYCMACKQWHCCELPY